MKSEKHELRRILIALVSLVKVGQSTRSLDGLVAEMSSDLVLTIQINGHPLKNGEEREFCEGDVVSLSLQLSEGEQTFQEYAAFPIGMIPLSSVPSVRVAGESGRARIENETNLILIGMPGAGKSTIGRELAKRLQRPFIDLDEKIESQTGLRLEEIIERDGYDRFLDLEAEFAREFQETGVVLATGGSVVYRPVAMIALQSPGVLIYLHTPIQELRQRLSNLQQRGVVLDRSQSLEDLYFEREPLYECYYNWKIENSGASVGETVEQIMRQIDMAFTDGI